jgi:hypothetical protein
MTTAEGQPTGQLLLLLLLLHPITIVRYRSLTTEGHLTGQLRQGQQKPCMHLQTTIPAAAAAGAAQQQRGATAARRSGSNNNISSSSKCSAGSHKRMLQTNQMTHDHLPCLLSAWGQTFLHRCPHSRLLLA